MSPALMKVIFRLTDVVAGSHNMLSALTTSVGVLTNNTPWVGGGAGPGNVNIRGGLVSALVHHLL